VAQASTPADNPSGGWRGAFRAFRPARLHGTERRLGKRGTGSRESGRSACLYPFPGAWESAFPSMFAGPALPFGLPAAGPYGFYRQQHSGGCPPLILGGGSIGPSAAGPEVPADSLLHHRIWPRLLRYAPLSVLDIGFDYACGVLRAQCLVSGTICGASSRDPAGTAGSASPLGPMSL